MNINISHCFFSRSLIYSGNSGVIYLSGGLFSMNINYSMFYNCVCSGDFGSIYFNSWNSYIGMVCANRCSCGSSSSGQFAYILASQMNQVEYLSISYCSHTATGYYPIYQYTGNQRVDNTNSSMNNAFQVSSFGFDIPSSFSSSHCTFSNNKVSDRICILYYSTPGTNINVICEHCT